MGKESKGLGDTVEKMIKKLKLDKIVSDRGDENEDCGCRKRKEKLNEIFPYNIKIKH